MDRLREALKELEESDYYPFHMPGHKRRTEKEESNHPFLKDITEIDGFDNLHHPEGIIKSEQEFAAKAFGAEESFFLVNGSSCGVLAAIAAVSADSDKKILMGRNAHKSAYNGLYFANVRADYLYPEKIQGVSFSGAIRPENVLEAVNGDTLYSAVFLTSPTYEGVACDVEKICETAHKKSIPVIVDEAHGAHLGLWGGDGYFPKGALCQGADIVIESLHKTLPAMTQTAILHVQGKLIDREKLKLYLAMFQSSSPSYVFLESISSCIHFCKENEEKLLKDYKKRLQDFYKRTKDLAYLEILTPSLINRFSGGRIKIEKDPGKIIIGVGKSGFDGKGLYDILREKYHLQMEMAAMDYVIAMTSVMDTEEGFERLIGVLKEIDLQSPSQKEVMKDGKQPEEKAAKTESACPAGEVSVKTESACSAGEMPAKTEAVYSIREALSKTSSSVDFDKCAGQISGEFIYLYPPGIPVIAPGERISEELLMYLEESVRTGLSVQGLRDYEHKKIFCIQDESFERINE